MKKIKFLNSKVLMRNCMLILFTWLVGNGIYANETDKNEDSSLQLMVKGQVVSEISKLPWPGVTVLIKGTNKGVVTDFDGNYEIEVSGPDAILVFSYVGYKTQEIPVNGQNIINVNLEEGQAYLNEVVVVGYGSQKKVNLTGAVSAIKGDEIANKPMADARQALQGVAPGLTIVDHGGSPGEEELAFNIRGVGSVGAGSNPLVLIDGIESSISEINPQDIESISVLKDAASSSIYGARAANGVLLITTKRGKEGKIKVSINSYTGWQSPASLPELVGAEDYLNLVNEANENAGLPIKYTDEYIQNTLSGNEPELYPYTNLFEELYNTAPVQSHSISLRGGTDIAKVSLSLNYLDQDGLIVNTGSKRIGTRLNTDIKLSESLKARANIYFNNRDSKQPSKYNEGIAAIIGTSPVTVSQYSNGVYGLNKKDNQSALAAFEVSGKDQKHFEELTFNAGLDWKIIDNLMLVTDYSILKEHRRYKNFGRSFEFADPNDLSDILTQWNPNQLWEGREDDTQQTFKSVLTYNLELNDDHKFNFLGGIESIENVGYRLYADRQDIYLEDSPELNTGDVTTERNSGYSQDWALMSYFGRFNYIFKDKILFEANIRRDGSSRFADGHKWGTFPSASAGWIITNEDFMSNVSAIEHLKLRASWGQLGNQDIGLYKFSPNVNSGYNYSFDDVAVNGYSQTTYANNDITWETSEQLNIGVDMKFLEGRLNVTADWFDKQTKDMLLQLPISALVGLDASETNIGSVSNTGWELLVNYHNSSSHEFNYSVGLNLSDVKNELTDFGGLAQQPYNGVFIYKEGEALNSFYGYKSDGLFQTQAEIDNHPTQPNQSQLALGDIKLVDITGDGVINDDDRTIIGNANPRYEYSFNFSSDYKGFDINIFLQGVGSAENYFYGAPNEGPAFETFSTTRVLDRWTPDNPNASFPRLEAGSNKNNSLRNDFWIRNSSYLRLKNLQVGYSLNDSVLEKIKIERLRFYTGGTNLFTITDVESGLDPETYSGRMRYYPPVSTFTLGVQVTF